MSLEFPWQQRALLPQMHSYDESCRPQPIALGGLERPDTALSARLCPELPADVPAYVKANFDYFYPSQADRELRQEFIRRDIIPTNNLRKYFDLSQKEYWKPGVRNPFHRNTHPFGHIISRLMTESPELWERAVAAEQGYEQARKQHSAALLVHGRDSDVVASLKAALDEATWHNRAVMSEVFTVIAPQMEFENFEPVSACI